MQILFYEIIHCFLSAREGREFIRKYVYFFITISWLIVYRIYIWHINTFRIKKLLIKTDYYFLIPWNGNVRTGYVSLGVHKAV